LFVKIHQSQGFSLTPLPGDKLEVRPASKLTPELRGQLQQRKAEVLTLFKTHKHPAPFCDYRTLYRQAAEAMAEDCCLIETAWLLAHPEFYEQIRALDEQLTTMEQAGAGEGEYRATLALLAACVQGARALKAQENEGAKEREMQ